MNGLPYYKAYPRDFIEGTVGMPFEMKCAYRVILDLIYLQGGDLPDDDRYISGLLGCTIRKWKSVRIFLIDAGKIQVSGDFLTNERAVSELETLAKLQDKQRENASRPNKNKGLQKPRPSQPEPEPEPEPKKERKNPQTPTDILRTVLSPDVADAFIEHRNAKRAPLTIRAAELIIKKLAEQPDPEAVIENSIMQGWTGVFPERKKNGQAYEKSTGAEIAKRAADRWVSRNVDRGAGSGSPVALFPTGQSGGRSGGGD